MKKILLFAVLTMAVTATSCKKDDDNKNTNKITFNGQEYAVKQAWQVDLGLDLFSLDFETTSGEIFEFSIYCMTGSTRIAPGTYNYTSGIASAPCITRGGLYSSLDDVPPSASMTSGNIKVDISGDTYTVTINGSFDTNKAISGSYTGKIELLAD